MTKNIAVIRGDGIGPEIVQQALRVLDRVAALYGHTFQYTDVDMGGCAIDKWGDPLPQEMLEKCLQSDSVLLGAVGGDKWNDLPAQMRPEKGLLRLRAGMGVYSNNQPGQKSGRSLPTPRRSKSRWWTRALTSSSSGS